MKKYINILLVIFTFVVLFTSCDTNLDLLDNPHELNQNSANPDYLLNSILINGIAQFRSLNNVTSPIIRQVNQFGTYTNNLQGVKPSTMNGAWVSTYQAYNSLKLLEKMNNDGNLNHHVAIGKIMLANELLNLVDFMGKAVYSEAVSNDFPTPGFDSGEEIYKSILVLLEESKELLGTIVPYTPNDLFYHGESNNWVKLANSLVLKIYVQSRKSVNFNETQASLKINEILDSNMYIQVPADDFQVEYGDNEISPDNRHPFFISNYVSGANTYMSNDFMNRLINKKNIEDPRLKHYIYRQTNSDPSGTFINDCLNNGNSMSDCYLGGGYWGRLHADESGVPNDNLLRATYGAYPAGGAFDSAQFLSVTDSNLSTLNGAGISPIITSSNINFLLAEAKLFISGVNGDAYTYLTNGVQNSFNKVSAFTGVSMANEVSYFNELSTIYNGTINDEEKLEVIIEESYISSFGNGIEPFNAYRRTGYPTFDFTNFQNPGTFPRSIFLPKSELDANDNEEMVQITLTDQVFWDTNPAGFID